MPMHQWLKWRIPYKIQSDRGKEFLNKDFQHLLKTKYIEFLYDQ